VLVIDSVLRFSSAVSGVAFMLGVALLWVGVALALEMPATIIGAISGNLEPDFMTGILYSFAVGPVALAGGEAPAWPVFSCGLLLIVVADTLIQFMVARGFGEGDAINRGSIIRLVWCLVVWGLATLGLWLWRSRVGVEEIHLENPWNWGCMLALCIILSILCLKAMTLTATR
jgi:hypothetical protein